MKRIFALLMALSLLFTTACAGKGTEPAVEPEAGVEAEAQKTAAPAEMKPGYVLTEIAFPDWLAGGYGYHSLRWDSLGDTIWLSSEPIDGSVTVAAYDTVNDSWQRYDLPTGEARYPYMRYFSVAEGSIWAMIRESPSPEEFEAKSYPQDLGDYILRMELATGETSIARLSIAGDVGTESSTPGFAGLLALDPGQALLLGFTSVWIIDPEANVLQQPELPMYGGGNYFRVNGQSWFYTQDGYALLDTESFCYGEPIAVNDRWMYDSNSGHFLATMKRALCSLDPNTGEGTELFQWMDVALSLSDMDVYRGLENSAGDFYYLSDRGLIRVTEGMVPVKKTLTLACFGDAGAKYQHYSTDSYSCSSEMMDAIIRFNNTDPEYRIEVKPLVFNDEAERNRMLVELATGTDVDLLDTSILPDRAIRDGVLVDMLPFIDRDELISREDFIPSLLEAMLTDGGLYEYTDKFTMLSMMTQPKFFPGREGWTVEAIREIISQNPELCPNVPRMSRDELLVLFSWAATAEFIDWQSMSCSFDSPAFQHWLSLIELFSQEGEYSGCGIAGVTPNMELSIGEWRRYCQLEDYTVAGFPESGGTGSYFMRPGLSWRDMPPLGVPTRVGIMASGKDHKAAWRFVRTLMLGDEPELFYGVPVLRAGFESAVERKLRESREADYEFELFSPDDAEKLREQVYNTTKMIHTDDLLLDMIQSEATAYLEGQKSAEEAAAQIQSRVSIYLAEQS